MDINKEIFRPLGIKNKLKMIAAFTEDELMRISQESIKKLIVRHGVGAKNSRNKHLTIPRSRRKGNDWNSNVEQIYIYKGMVYLDFYLQYDNTDTNEVDRLEIFMIGPDYIGCHEYEDRNGHTQTATFRYNRSQKAEVIRSILYAFVDAKYSEQ